MLLIFRLERLDVLPVQDLGVQQGFSASFRTSNKSIARSTHFAGISMQQPASLHRHTLRQIPRLVHVRALQHRHVIRQ